MLRGTTGPAEPLVSLAVPSSPTHRSGALAVQPKQPAVPAITGTGVCCQGSRREGILGIREANGGVESWIALIANLDIYPYAMQPMTTVVQWKDTAEHE